MKQKQSKALIEKSIQYGRKEAKMTLSQIKEKYFPNRNLNDLRRIKNEKSFLEIIKEGTRQISYGN